MKKLTVTIASPLGMFEKANPYLINLLDFDGAVKKEEQAPNLKAARKLAARYLKAFYRKCPHAQIINERTGKLEGVYNLYSDNMCKLASVDK